MRAIVKLVWAEEVIVLILLKTVREPSRDACHGKDWSEEVSFEAHMMVDNA